MSIYIMYESIVIYSSHALSNQLVGGSFPKPLLPFTPLPFSKKLPSFVPVDTDLQKATSPRRPSELHRSSRHLSVAVSPNPTGCRAGFVRRARFVGSRRFRHQGRVV